MKKIIGILLAYVICQGCVSPKPCHTYEEDKIDPGFYYHSSVSTNDVQILDDRSGMDKSWFIDSSFYIWDNWKLK